VERVELDNGYNGSLANEKEERKEEDLLWLHHVLRNINEAEDLEIHWSEIIRRWNNAIIKIAIISFDESALERRVIS
jgi:hypothetical protein